jgi:hypothetical protein
LIGLFGRDEGFHFSRCWLFIKIAMLIDNRFISGRVFFTTHVILRGLYLMFAFSLIMGITRGDSREL